MPVQLTITRKVAKKDYFKSVTQSNTVTASTSTRIHREMARFRAETSYTITVTFIQPFQSAPIGINNLKVYRFVPKRTGGYAMQNVNTYFDSEEDWLTTTGFTIKIDEEETLPGIWIEYNFTE